MPAEQFQLCKPSKCGIPLQTKPTVYAIKLGGPLSHAEQLQLDAIHAETAAAAIFVASQLFKEILASP